MRQEQKMVEDFMHKAGQEVPLKPTEPTDEVKFLRAKLISEEWEELIEALGIDGMQGQICTWVPGRPANMELVADAIADLLVVVLGTASACGLDAKAIFDEAMRSNMTKFIDGHAAPNGKWIKGPSYSPANFKPFIQ